MQWKYRVTSLTPTGINSPVASSEDWERWLNYEQDKGWEFVGQIIRYWRDQDFPQTFYVYRKATGE